MTPQPKEQSHSLPSIEEMRESFETYIRSSDKFKNNTPLGIATINGEFHHYMEPDTDTMWIGFGLGYRSHFTGNHARLLAQNEMLRKALESIIEAASLETIVAGTHKRSEAQELIAKARAALEQTEKV